MKETMTDETETTAYGWVDPRLMFGLAPLRQEGKAVRMTMGPEVENVDVYVELDSGEKITDAEA
jgi:hypothetical protein